MLSAAVPPNDLSLVLDGTLLANVLLQHASQRIILLWQLPNLRPRLLDKLLHIHRVAITIELLHHVLLGTPPYSASWRPAVRMAEQWRLQGLVPRWWQHLRRAEAFRHLRGLFEDGTRACGVLERVGRKVLRRFHLRCTPLLPAHEYLLNSCIQS